MSENPPKSGTVCRNGLSRSAYWIVPVPPARRTRAISAEVLVDAVGIDVHERPEREHEVDRAVVDAVQLVAGRLVEAQLAPVPAEPLAQVAEELGVQLDEDHLARPDQELRPAPAAGPDLHDHRVGRDMRPQVALDDLRQVAGRRAAVAQPVPVVAPARQRGVAPVVAVVAFLVRRGGSGAAPWPSVDSILPSASGAESRSRSDDRRPAGAGHPPQRARPQRAALAARPAQAVAVAAQRRRGHGRACAGPATCERRRRRRRGRRAAAAGGGGPGTRGCGRRNTASASYGAVGYEG